MDKRKALKVTKKAISAYLEDEEGLLDDYRYYVYVKKDIYDSVDMLNMTLSQRKSIVSKADLVTLDTACDAMYWIGKHATQAQLIDAFEDTKDAESISLETYHHQNTI
jgi:hypothetical protein